MRGGPALVFLSVLSLAAHAPHLSAQGPSVTIYNDGRVLVRREVQLDILKGDSEHSLPLGPLDFTSIVSTDTTVQITGATYDNSVDQQSVIRRALGRRLLFRYGNDTVSAVVVGVNPERYKLADGTITFERPGSPRFPADLVVTDPVVRLSLRSGAPRRALGIGYFTAGASWEASYSVVLGGRTARITGAAAISNSTLDLTGTEVQLLAGSVSRVPRADEMAKARRAELAAVGAFEDRAMAEQKVGEFHLYTLPGRTTLRPGLATSIAMFDPAGTRYDRTYEVRGPIPFWGGLPQHGEEEEVPVEVTYTFERARKTEFGERPLPAGLVRLYQPDKDARLQLVGEGAIGHLAAGEPLRVAAGVAFDLKAKRVQTSYTTRRDSLGQGRWQTSAIADYRVTLTNATDSAVTIDVIEERGGEWSVLSSSVKPDKLSSTRTRFRVAVPARGNAVLRYRVKVIW